MEDSLAEGIFQRSRTDFFGILMTMRAIVFDGAVRSVKDHPRPRPLGDEALIRVRCAGICATDIEITKGYMGFKGILGHEFSGVVEECFRSRFIGKRVAGEINLSCGACSYCKGGLKTHCPDRKVLGIHGKDGAFADYVTLPLENLHILPGSITDEEAVFIEPLAAAFETAWQVGSVKDKKVLVIGDGRLGMLISQVMRLAGADLTVMGRDGGKLSIIEGWGIRTLESGRPGAPERGFDIAVDAAGSREGFEEALKALKPRGTLVLKTTVAGRREVDLNRLVIDEITVVGSRCGPFAPAIEALKDGKIDVRTVISRVFPLEEGAEAIEYAKKKGVMKVILRADHP